jgi:NTE family protein
MATQQQIVLDLIDNPTLSNRRNIHLLKKYLVVCNRGWLLVNGSPPDKQISLAQYLVDNERVMFDFTRLSEAHKTKLVQWLIKPHEQDCEHIFVEDYKVNEYRGYPSEVRLNWWGRFKNSWIFKRKYHEIELSPLKLNANPQLNSLDYYQSDNGILFGLNHLNVDDNINKYGEINADDKPLRNAKRLYLTNEIVDELINFDINKVDYKQLLNRPHPYSIYVRNYEKRIDRMRDYREAHLYTPVKSFWSKLWGRIKSIFNKIISTFTDYQQNKQKQDKVDDVEKKTKPQKALNHTFYKDDKIEVQINPDHDLLLVTEKRPEVDRLVFCGGGAKIFGHWGAFEYMHRKGIVPEHYVGSSAGALIATFCYLGYTPEDMKDYFVKFNRDILVHNAFDRRGYSKTNALKSAIERPILDKFIEIRDNNLELLESSEKGRRVLETYNTTGKITFGMMETLRELCPKEKCSLKKSLTVTVTNATKGKTEIFSTLREQDKDVEMAEVIKISASIPVLFKSTEVDGDSYMDGGVLKNLPFGVLEKSKQTFLESHYGHDFGELGLQFNNGGVERSTLDKMRVRVYREGFIMNKVMSWFTGIDDAVSGWEKDRNILRQYALQAMIIEVGNIGSTDFNISDESREKLIEFGRKSAKNYIKQHYRNADGQYVMDELLYETFYLEELLCYCAYRRDYELFDKLAEKIEQSHEISFFEKQSCLETVKRLRKDRDLNEQWGKDSNSHSPSFQHENDNILPFSANKMIKSFFNTLVPILDKEKVRTDEKLFRGIHDIILKDWASILGSKDPMVNIIKEARKNISRSTMSSYISKMSNMMQTIDTDFHLFGFLFNNILAYAKKETIDVFVELAHNFCLIMDDDSLSSHLKDTRYTGNWSLSPDQCRELINELKDNGINFINGYLSSLKTEQIVSQFQDEMESLERPYVLKSI